MRSLLSHYISLFFVVGTYLFLYIPIIVLVIFSFNKAALPAPWLGFSLQWYQELWNSTHIWQALYTSLTVSICATFLSLLMTVLLVFYDMQVGSIERFLAIFYANLIVPEVVLAVGLMSFFSFFSIPLGVPTLIISHTVLGLGFAMPIVYGRFKELDYRLTEASLDLGATYGQTFFKVTMPLLKPSLFAAGLLVFIISFDDFVLSYFCAGSSAQTLSLYILSMLRSGLSPVVNALSTVLLCFSSILVILYCSLNARNRIL
ncbi:MAG TPA: ABC transporter permease [Candidatus Babeliaceae bacterium]|nr:ABC transporter permease [Candidatus Babeliaceae bacterium]